MVVSRSNGRYQTIESIPSETPVLTTDTLFKIGISFLITTHTVSVGQLSTRS